MEQGRRARHLRDAVPRRCWECALCPWVHEAISLQNKFIVKTKYFVNNNTPAAHWQRYASVRAPAMPVATPCTVPFAPAAASRLEWSAPHPS
jgi:hypothetical protein